MLAVDPGALRTLVGGIIGHPELARQAAACVVALPFAVARLWLDRDVDPARSTFSAVSREPTLDSVTVYSRLERPSAEWAARTGGSVVELHSYACDRARRRHGHRPHARRAAGAVARDRRRPRGAPASNTGNL